jgi:hypothetical protein
MKVVQVKRKTRTEKRYSSKMGKLTTKVTYIKKYVMGEPAKSKKGGGFNDL